MRLAGGGEGRPTRSTGKRAYGSPRPAAGNAADDGAEAGSANCFAASFPAFTAGFHFGETRYHRVRAAAHGDGIDLQLDQVAAFHAPALLHHEDARRIAGRGIDAKVIERFGIGFASDARGKLKAALKEQGEEKLIESGQVDPASIVALIGKTEGNGGANDFTRGYATLSYQLLLAHHLRKTPEEIGKRVAFVWSGGTEGVLSPHATVFTRASSVGQSDGTARLTMGIGITRDILPEDGRRATAAEIIKFVARHYELKVSEIKSKSNSKQIAIPRQVAMYLCKELTELSFPEIGRQFNDKHHSTVMYSVEKIAKLRATDAELDRALDGMVRHFG